MRYKIIFLVVVGLIENCLLTNFINGRYIFPGPQVLLWEHNGCGSPFDCFALALPVVILFRNLLGQRNIVPTTPAQTTPTTPARTTPTTPARTTPTTSARTTPTTPARTTPTTLTPIITTTASACRAGYSLYKGSCGPFCYRFEFSECRTWGDAQDICKREGGDLLHPSTCYYQFLRVEAQKNEGGCPTNFWLGASRRVAGGPFFSVRGGQISTGTNIWQRGQPDNANNDQNCLEMRKDANVYLANDQTCSQVQGFICQI